MTVLEASRKASDPLREGGGAAPYKEMARYLKQGAAGEVRPFDLPGRAESKVALHLFDRRGHPSFLEGI